MCICAVDGEALFLDTTSPESAPFLYAGNACEGHADVWPALPFVIQDYLGLKQNLDNIAALFEHSDRMCNIDPWGMHNSDHLEKIGAAMQGPSPELTDLHLRTYRDPVPVFPDSFLAGPAPRLRTLLRLDHFLFPGLRKYCCLPLISCTFPFGSRIPASFHPRPCPLHSPR